MFVTHSFVLNMDPSSKRKFFVILRSADRLPDSTSSTQFTLDLDSLFTRDSEEEKFQLTPVSITIPYTQYVVDTHNQNIYFQENGVDVNAVLTPGFYNATDLATEIESVMNAAGANTYSVTNNTLTYTFTIARTAGAVTFNFTWGTNTSNSARKLMGFSAADTTAGTTVTSDNAYNLAEPYAFSLRIEGASLERKTDQLYSTLTIPTAVQGGTLIHYKFDPNEVLPFTIPSGSLNAVRFHLVDIDNNSVDLHGADWHLRCLFEH